MGSSVRRARELSKKDSRQTSRLDGGYRRRRRAVRRPGGNACSQAMREGRHAARPPGRALDHEVATAPRGRRAAGWMEA